MARGCAPRQDVPTLAPGDAVMATDESGGQIGAQAETMCDQFEAGNAQDDWKEKDGEELSPHREAVPAKTVDGRHANHPADPMPEAVQDAQGEGSREGKPYKHAVRALRDPEQIPAGAGPL